MKKYSIYDIAYMAGYIDGDGCFYIGHNRSGKRLKPKRQMCIAITSTNFNILDEFRFKFGGSINIKKTKIANQKQLFQYVISKRNLLDLANKLLGFLQEKRAQCQIAIDYATSKDLLQEYDYLDSMNRERHICDRVELNQVDEFTKIRNSIVPNKCDFAYLAGFIDAECSLNIQRYKPNNKPNPVYKIILQCNNTKSPVFKWLMVRFGGQLHFIDRSKYENYSNQLTWRLSARSLSAILKCIYPFLRYKKPVCQQLMEFAATILPNGGARHTTKFRSQYASIIKKREEIVEIVHELNKKGV